MFSRNSLLQTRQMLMARTRMSKLPQRSLFPVTAMKFAHNDNFMSGANANYIDYMYSQWQKDPSSVHPSWNAYFAGEEGGASASF